MKNKKKRGSIGLIGILSIPLFLIGNKLGNNLKEIPKAEINGDTFAILLNDNQVSTLPPSGTYLIDYTCDNGSTIDWDRTTGKLYLSKNTKVQENCSLKFKTAPLASDLKQGDYVAYVGNNGCKLNGEALTEVYNAESSNSCLGYNANDTLDTNDSTYGYCYSTNHKFYVKGWRIAYTENNRAYLISAGSPECNLYTPSEGNVTYINEANEKAKKYCNSSYVDGNCSDNSDSWAIGDTDFNKITAQMTNTTGGYLFTEISGATQCGKIRSTTVCGYNNDLFDNGGDYWFAATQDPVYGGGVRWDPQYRSIVGENDRSAFGLRPIIRLSSSVYITGGSGTMDDPYTIANNTFSINNGATYTTNSTVTLKLVGSGSISQMCISNSKECTNYETFTNSKSWTLTSGDGEKKVYVYYKDSSGKIVASLEQKIILDTTPPTNNRIQISSEDSILRTLTLSSTGADYMCFSNTSSNVNDCTNWVDFSTTYSWTLSPNNGEKTVYAFFKDKVGHTASAQASVICNNCVPMNYTVNEDFADDTYDSNLTIAGSGDYPWIVSEGQFISNNKKQDVGTSTSTITFTPTKDSRLSLDYGMTSWGNTLKITLTGTDSSNKTLVELTYSTMGSVTDEPLSAGVTYTLKLESIIDNPWSDSYSYIDNLKIES